MDDKSFSNGNGNSAMNGTGAVANMNIDPIRVVHSYFCSCGWCLQGIR